jgi:hypothetical protein
MSHNLKTLKVVAPGDGELLLPTDYGKPGRLNSMGAIRSESARVCDGVERWHRGRRGRT